MLVTVPKAGTVQYSLNSSWTSPYTMDGGSYDSPMLHHATISALPPGVTFEYQVGYEPEPPNSASTSSDASGSGANVADAGATVGRHGTATSWQEQERAMYRVPSFVFTTPPGPGDEVDENDPTPMTLFVVGDMGQTGNSSRTVDAVAARSANPDEFAAAMIIIGDMAYADGGAERWDSWGRLVEPVVSQLPLMVLPGNHEVEFDLNTNDVFNPYRNRFRMPGGTEDYRRPSASVMRQKSYTWDLEYEGGSSYYSFDIGFLHVIALNTYTTTDTTLSDGTVKKTQQLWLEKDLAGVDRRKTPFIIVTMHGPLYNTNKLHQDEKATNTIKSWAEPLFNQYKVDAVFAGHVHAYERFSGTDQFGGASQDAPLYVTVGDGGNHEELYDVWPYANNSTSEFRDGRFYGHGEVTVYNRTHIKWSWVPNAANQGELAVRDEAWISPRGTPTPNDGNRSDPPPPVHHSERSTQTSILATLLILGLAVVGSIFIFRCRRTTSQRYLLRNVERYEEDEDVLSYSRNTPSVTPTALVDDSSA